MKLRVLLVGLIFTFCGMVSHAQVYEMYYNGFETNDPVNYNVTPTGVSAFDSQVQTSGNRSLKLSPSTLSDVSFIMDTLDFSLNSTLSYIALEFDQICNIAPEPNPQIASIWYKRANEGDNDWHRLGDAEYDKTGTSYSTRFQQDGFFHSFSYNALWQVDSVNNTLWKHERFNIINVITPDLPLNTRKLIIKFVIKRNTTASNQNKGWWLDNIVVRSSQNQMITPTITMRCYPDGGAHPSSRGARIELDATTVVQQGINPDSVYLFYKIGSSETIHKQFLTLKQGSNSRFVTRIPMEGYDTLMHFYCVVKDATTNANEARFPRAENSWVTYWCVRGVSQPGLATPQFTGTASSSAFPFPDDADSKSEWVYDSALLAAAGYGPGAITSLRYTVAANNSLQTRRKFQIRMCNAPTDYTVPTGMADKPFTSEYLHIVFDTTLVIQEVGVGIEQTIPFRDTFFYAGKDIIMQMIYDETFDPQATSIRMIPALDEKKTIFILDGSAGNQYDAYTATWFKKADVTSDLRPALVMTSIKNQPLVYDMGVSASLYPNYDNPVSSQLTDVRVLLKNFGENEINGVRISYAIDDTVNGYYDWTGSLAGQDTVGVTVATGLNLSSGYHFLRAWVEDTLTVNIAGAGSMYYRDHEPYNDTCATPFVVCEGPMHGTRQIGGNDADFNTIDEFLYAVSRCGVDDSLIVNIAAGYYPPFTVPSVPGTSAQNYIVMRPLTDSVVIYSDETMGVTEMVNMEDASYFRLRDMTFVRRSGALNNIVLLGMESVGCWFERCSFIDSMPNPVAAMRISALLHSGFSNGMVVDGCTFIGGTIGVNAIGQASDMRSNGYEVKNCKFYNQYTNAINVQNQDNANIHHNELYDVMSNSSYVMVVYECYGQTKVMANKVYTSHGASGIGVSNVHGTPSNHILIANNMIVCNDDGQSNQLTTPLNIIQGDWIDVVYNSVKMTAPMRNNVATATFGGGIINNSRFMNNIVACFDDANFAFNYLCNTSTNHVGHNVYYSVGMVLNRWSEGGSCTNLAEWNVEVPEDSLSQVLTPQFLNGSLVDLRTFNRSVKGIAIPIPAVTVDMFGTERNATAACPGAFEFVSLYYDFEPEALLQPLADNCQMPASVEMILRLRNSGVNAYTPGGSVPLSLGYQVNGGAIQTLNINQSVPAENAVVFNTGRMLQLPFNGILDSVYHIKVWTASTSDPNQTNDTNTFTVISRYHSLAPNNTTQAVNYSSAATITPVAGIDDWAVYNSSTAPRRKSTLYWYINPSDTAVAVGPTFTTGVLRQDTNFYFRQRRNMPIVRMTQLQLLKNNNVLGLTDPMPVWMMSGTKVAVQLTNVGDATAYLQGDTLMTVSPTSNINNKVFVFPDISIAPGRSLVVQYTSGTTNYPAWTVHTGTSISPNYNANIAFIYRRGGVVEDAVAFNAVTTTNSTQAVRWATQNVPSYVWNGNGIQIPDNTVGGIYRVAFNGDTADWVLASDSLPMFINRTKSEWVRYTDNGCDGDYATATVTMIAPPVADIELAPIELPQGCNLGSVPITVNVRNFGTAAVANLTLNYSAGGAVVSETVTGGIAARGNFDFTFSQLLDMAMPTDSLFTVRVWATAVSGDTRRENDTVTMTALSLKSPDIPVFDTLRTLQYATRDTLYHHPASTIMPVWYNADMQPVDTGYTHITDILYTNETLGLSYIVAKGSTAQVGTGTTLSGKTAYPNPYQPNNKFVKQQYIYSAAELASNGLTPGPISEVAFYLDSIWAGRDSVVFENYNIALGLTSDTVFSGTSDWKTTQVAYSRPVMTIYQNDVNTWVTHSLDVPFEWDGVSSIVVQVSHENSTAVTSGVQIQYTSVANTTLHKSGNTALSPSAIGYSGSGTKGNNRPNIRMSAMSFGCAGSILPIHYNLIGIPSVDASISWPEGSDTVVYNSCGHVAMDVDVRNLGLNTLNGLTLHYYLDEAEVDSTVLTNTLNGGQSSTVQLFSKPLMPGRHHVTVVASAAGDSIHSNDTIEGRFMVRFCTGVYTIAADNGDFHSFSEAIDTLNVAGISGPVTFNVASGIYTEQVVLTEVAGSSELNTLTFRGPEDRSAILTASTSQNSNYVFTLDGASNVIVENIGIEARPVANNVNYANALILRNIDNVKIRNNNIKVKGTINNANASCVILQDSVSRLLMQNNTIDSGYYSLRTGGTAPLHYTDITLKDNQMLHFWFRGIDLRNVTNINITSNQIRSGVTVASRALTGIALAQTEGSIVIQKNHIYLIDEKTGGKRGIHFANVQGTNRSWAIIKNNMISTNGTGTAGVNPTSGIYIDSSSAYINVYYNTVRVFAGQTQVNSNALYCGPTTSNLQVMNNIFANLSKSFTVYVAANTSVNVSNYNDYYTEGENIAYWGTNIETLTDLQLANEQDGSSMDERPYFFSSEDLHLLMTNFVARAQYNTEVTEDIDGTIRPQIPAPTIGAHEMERKTHNMSVVEIIWPQMPPTKNEPYNVESDSIKVMASFYNNGTATETNVRWYAYIEGHENDLRSEIRGLGTFQSSVLKTDSVMLPTVLGVIDTQRVHVALITDVVDSVPEDNDLDVPVYLAPAYNLEATRMGTPTGTAPGSPAVGCELQDVQIAITVKNSGFKDIPAGETIKIGYRAQGYHPNFQASNPNNNQLYIRTMPVVPVEEYHTFETALPMGASRTITFNQHANLYPTDTFLNIKVRINGWCDYVYDITKSNDSTGLQTSSSPVWDAYPTPMPPVGRDTTLAYGVWGEVTASQINNRPVRWYRDSLQAPYYAPTNYNASRKWSNTPQYFHDTTYYLQCFSDKGCPSFFSPVTVSVAPRIENDMAFESVLAPLGSRVYMENDTVRLRIINYGTLPQSNFPVVYRLKRSNNVLQEVSEICTATVNPMETYDFTFDSLLQIPTPTADQTYSLIVWTDLANDGSRRNDTIRIPNVATSPLPNANVIVPYTFTSLKESTYCTPTNSIVDEINISRFAFNEYDFDLPPLGRDYNNFGTYNNPEMPVLHITRGMADSLFVLVVNKSGATDTRANVGVYIDYDRSGTFSDDECVATNTDALYAGTMFRSYITIPSSASYGFMKMRVVASVATESPSACLSAGGHVMDFMLFVDEHPLANDLALTEIAYPRNYLINEDTIKSITFRMANRGTSPITQANIYYQYTDERGTDSVQTYVWTGNLQPGRSTLVTLPSHLFPLGTTTINIWHEEELDEKPSNNHLEYEYNRFHIIQLIMDDNFDSINYWYAPTGYNPYTRNYWQCGTPNKSRISVPYSEPNVWVTDTVDVVRTGKRGNVSYLYSPIINIAQIKPDTLSFRLQRNLTAGSSLHLEFFDYESHWTKVELDSMPNWYNNSDDKVFDGTSPGNTYNRYWFRTALISGDFQEKLQFRFVYTAPQGTNDNAAFGEGCAIDNFRIGRDKIKTDAGVIAITKPVAPKYGETIYPEVVVKNYGKDTIRNMLLGYTHYGTHLPKETRVECYLAPNETDTFQFTMPFLVTSDYPDTFYIHAFSSIGEDIYMDNDTASKLFTLAPLDNDISAESFIAPLPYVIAGDTNIKVTFRVRNFGVNPISRATASYLVNGLNRVDEEVDFEELMGAPLGSMEFYNYTFHQKFRATMGMMNITGIIKSDSNQYVYNDTVTKRILGISSITDVAAAGIIIDTSGHNWFRVQLIIDNQGARGANNFEVGFWIDNDTTTLFRETYYRNEPIPALTTGYHLFDTLLAFRTEPYKYVCAYVKIDDDNDPSNDTTCSLVEQYTDISVDEVIVEENASSECRTFIKVSNIGNYAFVDKKLQLRAIVNGENLSINIDSARIDPNQTRTVLFPTKIPKDPLRHYAGTGRVILSESNTENNQTSVVRVVNYVEGVPEVNSGKLVLEQNYPNPFSHQTTVPFSLPNAAEVKLFVMDALGHIVYIDSRFCYAGNNLWTINMDRFSSGVYYYGIEVDGIRQMRKMILH